MKNSIKLLFLFAICTLQAQEDKKIAVGPYIQQMSTRDVTISWSTIGNEAVVEGVDGSVNKTKEYEHHSIHLANLKANTTYSYDVLNDGTDEGKGEFTTYPDKNVPFNFVAIGDSRNRHDVHAEIVDKILEKKPRFIVNSGDLVADGLSIQDWEHFFRVNNTIMKSTPYYPVLGNHESDSKYYYDFFDLPNNERYYYYTVGDALFIVLDSEGPRQDMPVYVTEEKEDQYWYEQGIQYRIDQKKWLEDVLNLHNEAGFIFVFQHHPLYGVKKSRLEEVKMNRDFYGDIFARHGVQVFINGHDHHYHRAFDNGVHFITAAGAGAPLYKVDAPQPETVIYKEIEHFVNVEVMEDKAVLHVIDINGNEFDTVEVARRKTK